MTLEDEETFTPVRRRGLRTGFTTGACATAAAVAAARWLLRGETTPAVTIHLPAGRDVKFEIASRSREADWVMCSVIKDAGDDPDVTHKAEIRARLWRPSQPGLTLTNGVGVGRVTRPGLGLEIGGPAINPSGGLMIELSVPNGEALAKKTLNGRLGIVGGLSILGTTGIVVPYSTAAWRASVGQAVDVAAATGQMHVVLSTGGTSEKFAQRIFDLPEVAYVEMGEFTGYALKRCVQHGIRAVTLVGMIGKMSKIALGHFMTHVASNQVDLVFLAEVARECGASPRVVEEIQGANTARHFQEIALREGLHRAFSRVCQLVCERSDALVNGELTLDCIIFDFDGTVLGRAAPPVGVA